ncbi:MAG: hypothetical protein ACXIUM_02285 [Wenzhouxiangella sp.]
MEDQTTGSATGAGGDERPEAMCNAEPPAAENPLQAALAWAQASLRMARDSADLLAIELELAARSLALLIALSLLLAALGALIWILLLAAVGAALRAGPAWSWPSVFLLLTGLNGVLGLMLWQFIRRLARRLGLPGVRASMRSHDLEAGKADR